MQGQWKKIAESIKILLILTPIVAIGIMLRDASGFFDTFFNNKDVPLWLLIFGSVGQVIFALRFIYQFLYSAVRHESILPVGFWIISLVGSIIIISYALFRKDPVLILGQSFGFVAYIRNLMIAYKSRKITVYEE